MQGFKTREERKKSERPQQGNSGGSNASQPTQSTQKGLNTSILGSGGAAKAGNALANRARQIEEAIGYADGGVITGPGTGTSDDIKTKMNAGTYIMPADSTEQIGPETLAGLGSPADVRVSNGEYQMPPEQVHAVGAQVLDQMKDQTHTPTDKGFKPQIGRNGEQFFFGGGTTLGDEEAKKKAETMQQPAQPEQSYKPPIAQSASAPTPTPTPAQGWKPEQAPAAQQSMTPNAPPEQLAAEKQSSLINSQIQDQQDRTQHRKDMAANIQNTKSNVSGFVDSAAGLVGDAYKGLFNAATVVPRTAVGLYNGDVTASHERRHPGADIVDASKARLAQEQEQKAAAGQQTASFMNDHFARADNAAGLFNGSSTAGTASDTQAGDMLDGNQSPVASSTPGSTAPADGTTPTGEVVTPTTAQDPNMQNNIIQDGNSFSASGPIRSGYTVNGQAQGNTNVIPSATGLNPNANSAQNNAAKAALFDRTPEFGKGTPAPQQQGYGLNPQNQTRVTVVGDNSRADRDYNKAFAAASTAHRGAQNGQLTGNQLKAMQGLMTNQYGSADNRENNATSRYNSDSTNSANILRTNMGEAGANSRAAQSNQLDERRLTNEETVQGFATRTAARMENLYDARDAAKTDEQRDAIDKQLQILNNRTTGNQNLSQNFATVNNPDFVDPTTNMPTKGGQSLIDLRTGQPVGQQQQAPKENRFNKGQVYRDKDGKRFTWDGSKPVEAK